MKRLIVLGDAGVRKGGIVELDGEEYVVFGVSRQGEWHGPDRVQLWCTIGKESEREDYNRRNYIPMHLDVESIDAEALTVVRKKGAPAT